MVAMNVMMAMTGPPWTSVGSLICGRQHKEAGQDGERRRDRDAEDVPHRRHPSAPNKVSADADSGTCHDRDNAASGAGTAEMDPIGRRGQSGGNADQRTAEEPGKRDQRAAQVDEDARPDFERYLHEQDDADRQIGRYRTLRDTTAPCHRSGRARESRRRPGSRESRNSEAGLARKRSRHRSQCAARTRHCSTKRAGDCCANSRIVSEVLRLRDSVELLVSERLTTALRPLRAAAFWRRSVAEDARAGRVRPRLDRPPCDRCVRR